MKKLAPYNKTMAAALAGALSVFLCTRLGFSVEEATAAQTILTTILVWIVPNMGDGA